MTTYEYEPTNPMKGGEKMVFRGRRLPDGLPVVVKMLHPGAPSHAREHMRLEVQRALAAQGLGVARLIDHNVDHDPPFFVEEYFPEGTLADLMHRHFAATGQPLPIHTALGFAHQLFVTLTRIHGGNQIHRDLKPHNITVTGNGRELALIDFGIGRTLNRPAILQTRYMKGTMGYAAPEQEIGQPVDHRADLYAVGVILHEMLTGELGSWNHMTFRANGTVARVIATLLHYRPIARYGSALDAMNALRMAMAVA